MIECLTCDVKCVDNILLYANSYFVLHCIRLVVMDKEWTKLPRLSREYKKGVVSFLDFAFTKGKPEGREILCPCAKCKKHLV
jgi:hypothetical protein